MDRNDLQHDAFKLNGVYLEDVISGYTTAKAVGRESLEKTITTYENGIDGATIQRTNFPVRTIEITFAVVGSSLADLREKMHNLQTLLNVNGAEIVFNDDPNNYYIATPVMTGSISEAKNAAFGTYNLVCHDPFKYSKTLTTVQTTNYTETVTDEDGHTSSVTSLVLTTDNSGGYKTFPIFSVQFATDENASGDVGSNADCGYVLFAKGGTDYSIQIGDDQEKDTTTTTVVSHNFKKSNKGSFTDTNTLTPFKDNLVYNGSTKADSLGLRINTTTNVSKKFHGPLAVYTIASADRASADFSLTWQQVMACAKDTATGKKQAGAFWIMLMDANNVVKFAYGIEKSSTSSLDGYEYIYDYNNGLWKSEKISLKYTGDFGYEDKQDTTGKLSDLSIKRETVSVDGVTSNMVSFNSVTFSKGVTEPTACTIAKIGIFLGNYGSAQALHSDRVASVKFVNGAAEMLNSFNSGDLAVVDCGKAEITLNEKSAADLGDVGNNWEDMYLDVGTNTIYVQYSDWVNANYKPTITMAYRKRWL